VLPRTEHVDELQIDHVGLVLFRELEEVVWRHTAAPRGARTSDGNEGRLLGIR
jgi:hypothetical protein